MEAGYIFTSPAVAFSRRRVYLSYEDQSNNYVYFDDLKVTQTKSNLIQSNEYYPFGMQTANSWTRENTTGNSYLANGGTELNATSNLYDLEFRSFDPVLGRMHQVDPMTDKYSSLTPYNYSFNAPTVHNDVNGADPDFVTRRGINSPGPPCEYCGVNTFNNVYRGGGMFSMFYGQPGQWTPNANSFSSVGGMSINDLIQMQKDAKEMDSQEYAGKYGSAPTEAEIRKTFSGMGFSSDISIGSGQAYITFINPAVYSSAHGQLEMQTHFLAVINVGGNTQGSGPGDGFEKFGVYDAIGFGADMSEVYRQGYGAVQFGMRLGKAEQLLADAKIFKTMSASRQAFNTSVSAFKTGGRGIAAVGIIASGLEFATSDHSGGDYAKLGGAIIITGTAFIPVVGPFISVGLGLLDGAGAFDGLYRLAD